MSRISELKQLNAQIEQLVAKRDALMESPDLKKELEFEGKLNELLGEYGKSLKDIIKVIDPATKGTAKRVRAERVTKKYKNPHTGEMVETKGGNHKTLKEWKEKWGAEAVKSWEQ